MNCKNKKCPLLGISLIPLTQGRYAIVDTGIYDYLMQWKWCADKTGKGCYARRTNKAGYSIRMHRQILCPQEHLDSDHINRYKLDNRLVNLRECTRSVNLQNRDKQGFCSSKYKGVSWRTDTGKWAAYIDCNGQRDRLGCFDNEIDAAKAYNVAARGYFGEIAWINKI